MIRPGMQPQLPPHAPNIARAHGLHEEENLLETPFPSQAFTRSCIVLCILGLLLAGYGLQHIISRWMLNTAPPFSSFVPLCIGLCLLLTGVQRLGRLPFLIYGVLLGPEETRLNVLLAPMRYPHAQTQIFLGRRGLAWWGGQWVTLAHEGIATRVFLPDAGVARLLEVHAAATARKPLP